MEHLGREVIFTWDGYTVLGIREKGINLNGEPVDVTSDDDSGWRKLLDRYGQQQVDVTISGVVEDVNFKRDFFVQDGRVRRVNITYPDGNYITGDFLLVSVNESPPYNEANTFEATLQSTGPVEFVVYS